MDDEEIVFQDLSEENLSDTGKISFQGKVSSIPKTFQAPKYNSVFSAPKRRTLGFSSLRNSTKSLNFVIEDLLPETGLLYFAGESASGKTILAIQMMIDILMRRNTLKWKFNQEIREQKILVLSLEMNEIEMTMRLNDMYPKMSEDDDKHLEENFQVYCDFESFELWNSLHMAELHHMMKSGGFTGLMVDSASVSFAEEPNNAAQINKSIKNLYRMRAELGVWNGVIVHTRKPDRGNKAKPGDGTMHDIMGHSGFAQSASTILLLEPYPEAEQKPGAARKTHIKNAKSRYGLSGIDSSFAALIPSKKSVVEDGIPLNFMLNVPHVLPPVPKPRPGQGIKSSGGISLTAGLAGIDFGLELEDDDL